MLDAGAVAQEEGVPGAIPLAAQRRAGAIPSVSLDREGRSRAELCDLAAAPDGFVALCSDERDGVRWIRRVPLGLDLEPSGELERVDPEPSWLGQADGALAIGPSGESVAVWLDAEDENGALRGRGWTAEGRAQRRAWRVELPADQRPDRLRRALPSRGPQPDLVWADTGCSLAWTSSGRILMQRLAAQGPPGAIDVLGTRRQVASSAPRLARHPSGAVACGYDASGAVQLRLEIADDERAQVEVCSGRLLALSADPAVAEAAWWAVVRRQGRTWLLHLSRSGAIDRAELALDATDAVGAAIAADEGGVGVLLQAADGALRVHWVDPQGEKPSTAILAPAGTGPIRESAAAVSNGRRAFVWLDPDAAGARVVGVACAQAATDPPAPRDLFAAPGSATQEQPAAAFASGRGCVVWTDHRYGSGVVLARGWSSANGLGSEERPVPWSEGAAEGARVSAKRPAVAIDDRGRALIAWIGAGAGGPAIFVQAFEVADDGAIAAVSEPREVEDAPVSVPTHFPPAVAALSGSAGFAVAWSRAAVPADGSRPPGGDDGSSDLRVVRVDRDGEVLLPARTAATGPRLSRPSLVELDDRRIVVAWDAQPKVRERRLAARVFSPRLEPDLRELGFETMWRGSDHSPSLAAAKGGFAMAWTAGEDADRDVFARLYDGVGRPLSRPYALSTRLGAQHQPRVTRMADGGHFAVWLDDLGGLPRAVGRRFHVGTLPALASNPRLPAEPPPIGPLVRFEFAPESAGAPQEAPCAAAAADGGVIVVAGHALPGQGREVGLAIHRDGFDQVEGR